MSSSVNVKRYTLAELFCGCGGFSHGFARTGRFDVVLGIDIKAEALRTFEINHFGDRGAPAVIKEDIRTVTVSDIHEALASRGVYPGELDCLIGGPPCQGFSQLRRSEEREASGIVRFKGYDRLSHDPRNDLVLRFLEIAEALRPRFIVIENVPQMMSHGHRGIVGGLADAIEAMLDEMDYRVVDGILNAADYGVPQLRERTIIIAARDHTPSLPRKTHYDPSQQTNSDGSYLPWVTVHDAISDLPSPPLNKDSLGGGPLSNYVNCEVSDYALKLRSCEAFPYNHVTRRYNARIINLIQQMRPGEDWDSASKRMRDYYEGLIEEHGGVGDRHEAVKKELISRGVINPAFYKRYYWSAYTRLDWEQPALTITANANFLGSGRFTHPEAHRGITMREAARLQSFDDDFRFITSIHNESSERIGVGMDMIGEAVPPLMAEAIAMEILRHLDQDVNVDDPVTPSDLRCAIETAASSYGC